jgi:hypothetical protein
MPKRSSSHQETDPNRLAFLAVQKAIENGGDQPAKDPLAVELGRRGGLKGGKARSASLSPARRKAIARKGARARWKDRKP